LIDIMEMSQDFINKN